MAAASNRDPVLLDNPKRRLHREMEPAQKRAPDFPQLPPHLRLEFGSRGNQLRGDLSGILFDWGSPSNSDVGPGNFRKTAALLPPRRFHQNSLMDAELRLWRLNYLLMPALSLKEHIATKKKNPLPTFVLCTTTAIKFELPTPSRLNRL